MMHSLWGTVRMKPKSAQREGGRDGQRENRLLGCDWRRRVNLIIRGQSASPA
ncbi:hypothetical protein BKA69DRAFT_1077386 [Paraphysoderma sedebokerense]|nr:hypothetical protein BKA69DRAFT_1077386 [Paraphysoderma sedebokerense]